MKSTKAACLLIILSLMIGCGGGGGSSSSDSSSSDSSSDSSTETVSDGYSLSEVTGDNVITLTVSGSECSSATLSQWPNKACVSVTVCDPSSTYCQTINDILLDTGD
jgi:hypothetical protein